MIDSREKDAELIDSIMAAATEHGYDIVHKTLSVGDFYWDDVGICIEHKSTKDFLSSLTTGHLYSQLRDLEVFPHPYLFIDGEWPYQSMIGQNRLTQKIVAGMLCNILYHFPNIRTFHWPNDTMFAQSVVSLRNRASEPHVSIDIVKRIPSKTVKEEPNLAAYLSIPGIGGKKAEALQLKYGLFVEFLVKYSLQPQDFQKKGNLLPKVSHAYLIGLTQRNHAGIYPLP